MLPVMVPTVLVARFAYRTVAARYNVDFLPLLRSFVLHYAPLRLCPIPPGSFVAQIYLVFCVAWFCCSFRHAYVMIAPGFAAALGLRVTAFCNSFAVVPFDLLVCFLPHCPFGHTLRILVRYLPDLRGLLPFCDLRLVAADCTRAFVTAFALPFTHRSAVLHGAVAWIADWITVATFFGFMPVAGFCVASNIHGLHHGLPFVLFLVWFRLRPVPAATLVPALPFHMRSLLVCRSGFCRLFCRWFVLVRCVRCLLLPCYVLPRGLRSPASGYPHMDFMWFPLHHRLPGSSSFACARALHAHGSLPCFLVRACHARGCRSGFYVGLVRLLPFYGCSTFFPRLHWIYTWFIPHGYARACCASFCLYWILQISRYLSFAHATYGCCRLHLAVNTTAGQVTVCAVSFWMLRSWLVCPGPVFWMITHTRLFVGLFCLIFCVFWIQLFCVCSAFRSCAVRFQSLHWCYFACVVVPVAHTSYVTGSLDWFTFSFIAIPRIHGCACAHLTY